MRQPPAPAAPATAPTTAPANPAAAAAGGRRREAQNFLLVQALSGRPVSIAARRQLTHYVAGRLSRAEAFANLYEFAGESRWPGTGA